jgi:hypothetical protein
MATTNLAKQSGRWNQIKSNQIQEAVSCTVCNIWTDMSRGERILQNGAPEILFPYLISLVVLFLIIPHFQRAKFAILVKHIDVWHAILDRL